MNKLFCFGIFFLGLSFIAGAQPVEIRKGEFAWELAGSNRRVGLGGQYTLQQRWNFSLMAGLCNEFQEKKWNDGYMEFLTGYSFHRKKWRFPFGILGGIRWLNDYGHHFPVCYGGMYGGVFYRFSGQGIGVQLGAKYGKKDHLLQYSGDWGKVSGYETYRERPLFFTVYYQFFL